MRYLLFIFIFPLLVFCHDSGESRADFFKNDLNVSLVQFEKIESIDNRYMTTYEKLYSKLDVTKAELTIAIKKSPYNEKKVIKLINESFSLQAKIKLHNVKHHLEIEALLDSFQRMKFNEVYSP